MRNWDAGQQSGWAAEAEAVIKPNASSLGEKHINILPETPVAFISWNSISFDLFFLSASG